MKLWQTRRHWEKLAQTDPFWAVLAEPGKLGNQWPVDAFFARGREEIGAVLAEVRAYCPDLPTGRALDFGCGVGRLTQALAGHFDHVTGVDVTRGMLALARRHNALGDRVTFVRNTRPHLRRFASGSFDFVCSLITLQHVAPEYSRQYIAEFVRLLAPGGAAYFQIPSAVPPEEKEPWKHSFWLPTLSTRLRRFGYRYLNLSMAFEPLIEMHALPSAEVADIITRNGGTLLATTRREAGKEIESCTYLVGKRIP